MLHPKADLQGSKFSVADFRLTGPYLVEKAILNSKNLVRKIGTDKTDETQILNRIHLPPLLPKETINEMQTASLE